MPFRLVVMPGSSAITAYTSSVRMGTAATGHHPQQGQRHAAQTGLWTCRTSGRSAVIPQSLICAPAVEMRGPGQHRERERTEVRQV